MATVDFSNAEIEPNPDYSGSIISLQYLQMLNLLAVHAEDENGNSVVSSITNRNAGSSVNTLSVGYSGVFSTSGTEFYLGGTSDLGKKMVWKITGVSFSSGDDFDFIIDAVISGS